MPSILHQLRVRSFPRAPVYFTDVFINVLSACLHNLPSFVWTWDSCIDTLIHRICHSQQNTILVSIWKEFDRNLETRNLSGVPRRLICFCCFGLFAFWVKHTPLLYSDLATLIDIALIFLLMKHLHLVYNLVNNSNNFFLNSSYLMQKDVIRITLVNQSS